MQEAKVQFSANTDRKLLTDAITATGQQATLSGDTITFADGSYDCRTNEFTFRRGFAQTAADERVKTYKRAYSAQVVVSQARRFGWQVKKTGDYAYEVMKR